MDRTRVNTPLDEPTCLANSAELDASISPPTSVGEGLGVGARQMLKAIAKQTLLGQNTHQPRRGVTQKCGAEKASLRKAVKGSGLETEWGCGREWRPCQRPRCETNAVRHVSSGAR